jgi:hypothetical protein
MDADEIMESHFICWMLSHYELSHLREFRELRNGGREMIHSSKELFSTG